MPYSHVPHKQDVGTRKNDPAASHRAAVSFKKSGALRGHHALIYNAINKAPLTNMQIARAIGLNQNQVTRRVTELERRGLIERSKEKLCPYLGRFVTAWVRV